MAKKRTAAQKAADKWRTGRPPKADGEKRSEPVMVYLTKAEREELKAVAEAEGVTLATLIMSRWRDREE